MRILGLEGESKWFDGKLVGMQAICRTNIQTAPGDIYDISPRDTLAHVVIQALAWWDAKGSYGILTSHASGILWDVGGISFQFVSGEVVMFGAILLIFDPRT